MNLLLTHIKLVKLLWDEHTLPKESLNTFKIDKTNSEWDYQNEKLRQKLIKINKVKSATKY